MSDFLSYSSVGARVAGFRPLCRRRLGSTDWEIISPPANANTPAFLTGWDVVYQDTNGPTPRIVSTAGASWDRGASVLFAGGGRWVARYQQHIAGTPAGTLTEVLYDGPDRVITGDVRTTGPDGRPRTYWGAGQHGVGLDGTLAYCPRFHEGRGVVIEDASGAVLAEHPTLPMMTSAVVDRSGAVFYSAADMTQIWVWDGTAFRSYPLAFPTYGGGAFRWRGRLYVVYSSGTLERTIVHAVDDARKGWLYGRAGHCYNTCGWGTDTAAFVSWSENAGASVVWKNGEVIADSTREAVIAGPPTPWPTLPFRRTLVFTPYWSHSLKYGVTARFIGNVAFPDRHLAPGLASSWPLMTSASDFVPALASKYRYHYIHASAFDADARRQFDFFQDKPRRDLLIYLDTRDWPKTLPSWVPSWAILCGQAYLNPGESFTDFDDAMRDLLDRMRTFDRPLALTTCHFDRNGAVSVDRVRQLTPIYERLVRDYNLCGLMPFSDMREGETSPGGPVVGGMHRHPVLYDEAQTLFDLVPPGPLPSFVPVDPPTAPFFPRLEPFMAETRFVYLKSREYFIGVDPSHPDVVYADRTQVGGWERAQLTKESDEEYSVLFVDANRQLSQQPDGTYQTRPAGHVQSWERLRGGRLPSGVEILGQFLVVPA